MKWIPEKVGKGISPKELEGMEYSSEISNLPTAECKTHLLSLLGVTMFQSSEGDLPHLQNLGGDKAHLQTLEEGIYIYLKSTKIE